MKSTQESIIRDLHSRGFRNISWSPIKPSALTGHYNCGDLALNARELAYVNKRIKQNDIKLRRKRLVVHRLSTALPNTALRV